MQLLQGVVECFLVRPDIIIFPLLTIHAVKLAQRLDLPFGLEKSGYGVTHLIERSELKMAVGFHFHGGVPVLVLADEVHEGLHMREQIHDMKREVFILPFLVSEPLEQSHADIGLKMPFLMQRKSDRVL